MIAVFSEPFFEKLNAEALVSTRNRQHRNIHESYEEPCQRLFNAVGMNSYIRPHRHLADPKTECLFAIRGLFALVVFRDGGELDKVIKFGSEKYADSGAISAGVQIHPGLWHTVVAIVEGSVLLEIKAGPFDPDKAKEFAAWAPAEGSAEAGKYLQRLLRSISALSVE